MIRIIDTKFMPKKIILVRHGETDYNKERRMQGWLDVPLNQSGRKQAEAASVKLASTHVDALYSSDLLRAHQTAQTISVVLQKEIITTSALRERGMGIFSGWKFEVERDPVKDELWTEFQFARDNEDLDWNKHQGESMRQMAGRIENFMKQLHVTHKDQTVLIVTHGGTINRILEHYQLKSSNEGYRDVGNASVLILHKEFASYQLEEM